MLTFCIFLEFEYSLNFGMVLENSQSTCSCFEQVPDYQDQAVYNFWYWFCFSFQQIPSIASLLFLLKDFLCIQDLSVTELELSFIYASKSSLLARIFTALLITPHQRKRWNISIIFMHVFYNLLSISIFLVCVSFMLVQFSVRLKIFDFLVAFNLSNI